MDLVLREGLSFLEALPKAFETAQQAETAGIDFVALEESARQGLGNGAFEESEEERPEVLAEFCPEVAESEETALTETVVETEAALDDIVQPSVPVGSGRLMPVATRRVG